MFWSWEKNGQKYLSWGQPHTYREQNIEVENLTPDYNIKVYSGEPILSGEVCKFHQAGNSATGMGDSIWLISYLHDLFRIKARGRCELHIYSSPDLNRFYSHFFPSVVKFFPEYMLYDDAIAANHRCAAMYYWHNPTDNRDVSWLDNKSILQHLYDNSGLVYNSLPDFSEFTDEKLLYPNSDFYTKLGIKKEDKYVFFQWHSSGYCKNLPVKSNIKLIKHIRKHDKLKVYVIGRLNGLNKLEQIPGVKNLSNKTTAEDVVSLAFNAEWIVSPDSAGIHLSEAFRIPSVGIFGSLPPVYVASKYRIPAYMFGNGYCRFSPCGYVDKLPLDRCPEGTTGYCAVLQDIDLKLFDRCLEKSIENRLNYRSKKAVDFYESQYQPISLV